MMRLRATTCLAVAWLVFTCGARPAIALTTQTVNATLVVAGADWTLPDEAQGAPGPDCNSNNYAVNNVLTSTGYLEARTWPVTMPAGEEVYQIYVDVNGRYDQGTNNNRFWMRVRNTVTPEAVKNNFATWNQTNVDCDWRAGGPGGAGWKVDSLRTSWTLSDVQNLWVAARRINNGDNVGLPQARINAFRLTLVTRKIAPATPINLSGNPTSSSISLSWAPGGGGGPLEHYRIQRWSGGVLQFETNLTSTSYNDPSLPSNTTYEYRVYGGNSDRLSTSYVSTVVRTLKVAPATPQTLAVTNVTTSTIALSWAAGGGGGPVEDFLIERQIDGGGFTGLVVVGPGTFTHTDNGLASASPISYRVIARNSDQSSGTSNPVSAKLVPATPVNLATGAITTSSIALTWAPGAGGGPVENYQLERRIPPAAFQPLVTLGSAPTTHTDTGLNEYVQYEYRVRATNSERTSAFSSPASARTLNTPARLAIPTTMVTTIAGQVLQPAIRVLIQDAQGNPVANATNLVTMVILSGPGGPPLSGTFSRTASGGEAIFSDLSLTRSGNYVLQATSPDLEAAQTNSFRIDPAAAAKLAFTFQPGDAGVSAPISPAVEVAVQDAYDNVAPAAELSEPNITLEILSNPAGAILSGNLSRQAEQGLASFDDVAIDRLVTGYQLKARSNGLAAASSLPFNVVPYVTRHGDHLVAFYEFDDADSICQTRGWQGADRSRQVFASVSPRFVVHGGPMEMGTRALWFGMDSTSAETRSWVNQPGYGNHWSQRLTSPAFSLAGRSDPVLRFIATVDFAASGSLIGAASGNEFLAVQGLRADGTWAFLDARYTPLAGSPFIARPIAGRGEIQAEVHLLQDGNETVPWSGTPRVRIVVQTDSSGSHEDGGVPPGRGAAQIDQLRMDDGATPMLTLVDFDGGTTGAWTLSAQNGLTRGPGSNASFTRDVAATPTQAQLKRSSVLDPSIPLTCFWTFLTSVETSADGAYARLTSPWLALPAGTDSLVLGLSGRLPTAEQLRAVKVLVRGKRAGDARPRFTALRRGELVRPFGGDDRHTAFGRVAEMFYPQDFTGTAPCDSVQLVVEFHDRAEAVPGGFATRPSTRLPFLDRIYLSAVGMDDDDDGVANPDDACPAVSAVGTDLDANGCPSATATFNATAMWIDLDRPIHYVLADSDRPGTYHDSRLESVRKAFASWATVPGTGVSFQDDGVVSTRRARWNDGVNLVTFEDALLDSTGSSFWDETMLGLTIRTAFERRSSYRDRVVLPAQIVDADILFNPQLTFSTPATGPVPDAVDLESVAAHEIGHLLGLKHSPLKASTMYFQIAEAQDAGATLEEEDRSALCAQLPGAGLSSFGSIRGTVKLGADLSPVVGAAVLAIRIDGTPDTVAVDYTAANGTYSLVRLAPGTYKVRVEPFSAFGPACDPARISPELAAISGDDTWVPEFWTTTENGGDPPAAFDPIAITAGENHPGVDMTTNVDATPPTVGFISPMANQQVPTDAAIVIQFSEPVDARTIPAALRVLTDGDTTRLKGRGELRNGGTTLVFVTRDPMAANRLHHIVVGTALADANGIHLGTPATIDFTTAPRATPLIDAVIPVRAMRSGVLTLLGSGMDPAAPAQNSVVFSCSGCPDRIVQPDVIDSRWLNVTVPADAATGTVRLVVAGVSSNSVPVTIATAAQIAGPRLQGAAVSVDFVPNDLAFSANQRLLFVAGSTGVVAIDRMFGNALRGAHTNLGVLRNLAAGPDTARVWATQPDAGRLLELDATMSALLETATAIDVGGRPGGLALSPTGRQAFVVDVDGNRLIEVDVDRTRASHGSVLRTITFPDTTLDGGIAVHPRGRYVFLSSPSVGVFAVDLDTDDRIGLSGVELSRAQPHALACGPDGTTLLVGDGGGVHLLSASAPTGTWTERTTVSSTTAGVALTSDGLSALAAMPGENRLRSFAIAQGQTSQVGATSGAGPGALAVDRTDGFAALAQQADRTVQLYALQPALSITGVVPPVVLPGEHATLFSSALTAGSSIVIGSQSITPIATATEAASFAASTVWEAARTTIGVSAPNAAPTLSLPLVIVPSVEPQNVRPTGLALAAPLDTCAGNGAIGAGALRVLSPSPDGRRVAAVYASQSVSGCPLPAAVEIFDATDAAPAVFGRWRGSLALPLGFTPTCASFSRDGTRLWIGSHDGAQGSIAIVDVTVTPPALAQTLANAVAGRVSALAADPLGRWMYAASSLDARVRWIDPTTGAVVDTAGFGTHRPESIAPTRDGTKLVVGGEDRVWQLLASGGTVSASGPVRAGDPVVSVAATRNGQRVAFALTGGGIGAWNPAAAAQSFYIPNAAPGGVRDLDASTSGDVVLGRRLGTQDLALVNTSGAGSVAFLATPSEPALMCASAVGRQVWIAYTGGSLASRAPANRDSIQLHSVRPIDVIAVSGARQSAGLGQTLPFPILVHVADPQGRPADGVPVRVTLGNAGQGWVGAPVETSVVRVTDVTGGVRVPWTLGSTAGEQSIQVEVLGLGPGIQITATASATDEATEPTVIEVGPDGSDPVPVASRFFVRFNQMMDAPTVRDGMRLLVGGDPIEITVDDVDEARRFIVQPKQLLPFSTPCTLQLNAGRDLDGQALLDSVELQFTTEDPPAVQILGVEPVAATPGARIKISGRGFQPLATANAVTLEGRQLVVDQAREDQIVAFVPADIAAGSFQLRAVSGSAGASNILDYHVIQPGPPSKGEKHLVPAHSGPGGRDIAIDPSGKFAWIVNPEWDDVDVYSVSNLALTWLRTVPAGDDPVRIALHPHQKIAYVANRGSQDVSVISYEDVDDIATIGTFQLNGTPKHLGFYYEGGRLDLLVFLESGAEFVYAIGADYLSDGVAKPKGGGSTAPPSSVTITDGGLLFLSTPDGATIVDLATKAVKKVPVRSGLVSSERAKLIAKRNELTNRNLTPGTYMAGITGHGSLVAIDTDRGSPTFGTIRNEIKGPAPFTQIRSTPSGSGLLVHSAKLNTVYLYSVSGGTGGGRSASTLEPTIGFELIQSVPVAADAQAITMDPLGRFALVTSTGSSMIERIDFDMQPPVIAELAMPLDEFDLSAFSRWAAAHIELPVGFGTDSIDVNTLRLGALIPIDPAGTVLDGDADHDGLPELIVPFDRTRIPAALDEGDAVSVAVSGELGARILVARDTTRYRTGRIKYPTGGETFRWGTSLRVTYDTARSPGATSVAFFQSVNDGRSWSLIGNGLPHNGQVMWTVPAVPTDSARLAVVEIESALGGSRVKGVLAMSERVSLSSSVDAPVAAPVAIELAAPWPNPALDAVTVRFGLPAAARVRLQIFDVQGRVVGTIADGKHRAGWHTVRWEGSRTRGRRTEPGVYFSRLTVGSEIRQRRFVLLR